MVARGLADQEEGLWQGVGGRSEGDPQARLSRWRGVMAKARSEGFL